MISVFLTILTVIVVFLAVILICLVLLQQSKGAGLGSMGGGVESLLGATHGTALAKFTAYCGIAFLFFTLVLTIISPLHKKTTQSLAEAEEPAAVEMSAPAADENAAPAADAATDAKEEAEAAKEEVEAAKEEAESTEE